jgi:acetyl-CoA carboxylase carboxyltransferase component
MWQEEVEELAHRKARAPELGGEQNVVRQHAADKLTVRERIAALLDKDSFRETGALSGEGRYDAQNRNLDMFDRIKDVHEPDITEGYEKARKVEVCRLKN